MKNFRKHVLMNISRKIEACVSDFTPPESKLAKQIQKFQVVLMKNKLLSEAMRHASRVLIVRIQSASIWATYSTEIIIADSLAFRFVAKNLEQNAGRN